MGMVYEPDMGDSSGADGLADVMTPVVQSQTSSDSESESVRSVRSESESSLGETAVDNVLVNSDDLTGMGTVHDLTGTVGEAAADFAAFFLSLRG